MNKICTSIEQSQKLIDLGIDVSTADMCWQNNEFPIGFNDDDAIPAWSLSALLDIIEPVNNNTYTLKGTLDGGAMISFDEVTNVMFQEKEIIDAVFEMVVWLKENNKI